MRYYTILLVMILGMVSAVIPIISHADSGGVLAIIVQPEHGGKILNKSELALIFWRKKLYWASGKRIRPVNFPADNLMRNQFSKRILNSLPETQTDYWNGLYYHGVSPPHVVYSAEAMIRFVAETTGSIGYLPACEADSRVKILVWISSEGDFLNEAPHCE
ncbi:MAG: hypothetical protein ACT4OH_08260 [Methylophilaceae bacterium]